MFEYDPDKSAANLAKHGIDFEQAQALWDDDRRIFRPTYQGVDGEIRWLLVGLIDDKPWSAIFAEREDIVRIISVRRSRDNEKEAYYGQND